MIDDATVSRTGAACLFGTWLLSAAVHVYVITPASVLPRIADGAAGAVVVAAALLTEGAEEDEIEERPEDVPYDVPSKATTTIKDINNNRYYYWQWRDGDKIRSQYKGPVNPDE